MKRVVLWLFGLFVVTCAEAQEGGFRFSEADSLRPMEWHVRYDSLHALHLPLMPPEKERPLVGNFRIRPLVPGSSIVRLEVQGLPSRIYVLNNITLQVGGYINLTNGQAWIFGPTPAAFLDARTLSLPLPR